MMSDSDNAIGYAAAADSYWQAGWVGVLPMERGAKKWPPSIKCPAARAKKPDHNRATCPDCISYTGHTAIDPSYADIMAWSDQFRDGNLCLRTPDGVIGIDIDAYGVKTGAAALAEAVRRWGPLPAGPRSTSREDPISGIRLFTVPPGTMLEDRISFPELGIGDIELCQPHHRYIIAWPSIHPEGGTYWWRNDNLQLIGIPRIDELPALPAAWIDGLKVTRASNLANTPVDVTAVLTAGQVSLCVQQRLSQAIKELNLPGQSRHDTACRHVMALMRMGKSGEPGVQQALSTLREVFVASRQVDKSASPEASRDEFDRMITNDNVARELANPGINDWIRTLVIDEARGADANGQVTQRQPDANPQVDQRQQAASTDPAVSMDWAVNAPSDNEGRTPEPTRSRSRLEEIEQGFWQSRESLAIVYQTAMARMCPPWAVLGICAARALTQVRPHVTLPPLIGGPGSLNWFVGLVADSAGGKTTSGQTAEFLVPGHVEIAFAGSGEGILSEFGRSTEDENRPEREALLVDIDEIDTLLALNSRSASTTLPVLRSAFSGAPVGFSYSAKDKKRKLGRHTYRMTLVMGVQPTRGGWLLADQGGGTPQRFMWFPAKDARISRNRPWDAGPLTLPHPSEWLYPREIQVPKEAEDLIIDECVKRNAGEIGALNGHALYCREKFAYALAVLDGRVNMTSEDWELSGIASNISTFTRESVADAVREAATLDAMERGQLRGVEMESADVERIEQQVKRTQRVMKWLLHKLDEGGTDGISQTDLAQKITSRDRPTLNQILGSGHQLIRSTLIDGSVIWFRA